MKTAVITGSTRGLGFEMAKQFCMKGVNVVINGVNEKRPERCRLLRKAQRRRCDLRFDK